MKPIVVIKEDDGKVHLTPEEIQKIVDDAYNAGYSDGSKNVPVYIPSTYRWNLPSTAPNIIWTASDSNGTTTCHDVSNITPL